MYDNNAPKSVPGPLIEQPKDLVKSDVVKSSGGTKMGAISGSETNSIESMKLSDLADKSDKPLVDSGKEVVKASQGKKEKSE